MMTGIAVLKRKLLISGQSLSLMCLQNDENWHSMLKVATYHKASMHEGNSSIKQKELVQQPRHC